jgi:hypothetical protein
MKPYKCDLKFNNKHITVIVFVNGPRDYDGMYHYDLELRTAHRISGNEFQKLKKYLEDEGYIDDAIKHYGLDGEEEQFA